MRYVEWIFVIPDARLFSTKSDSLLLFLWWWDLWWRIIYWKFRWWILSLWMFLWYERLIGVAWIWYQNYGGKYIWLNQNGLFQEYIIFHNVSIYAGEIMSILLIRIIGIVELDRIEILLVFWRNINLDQVKENEYEEIN